MINLLKTHQELGRQQVAGLQHELERFQAELEFGRLLCEWHPLQARSWDSLLRRAAAKVDAVLKHGGTDPSAAVREAEKTLTPLTAVAKSYTVYGIGHAHIDMNWMWSWPETVAVTNDTFTTVLRLMEEFPEFHFSQSQASVYAIMEKYNPELLAQIAARVREGRWEVTASHWVENDNNMAGSESLCRHLLYTRRYLQELFGLKPEDVPVNWAPDTFGHAVTIPSYLVRGGVKYMYLHRPGGQGLKRPSAFWWQAPDGSRVLVRNDMKRGYNGVITPENLLSALQDFVLETGIPAAMYVYGVGDHGGGPTRRDLLRAADMNAWPVFPTVKLAAARTFFARLEQEGVKLPELKSELNFEFAGCYTSQALIKKCNRFGENRLVDAETVAAVTFAALGRAWPGTQLREGWQDTLFSHFHDILPGSGVHDTRTYTHGLFQKTMAMTSMVETQALRQLAAQVNTAAGGTVPPAALPVSRLNSGLGGGVGFHAANGDLSGAEASAGTGPRPFLIFNPLAWEREEFIEATIWDNVLVNAPTPFKNQTFSVRTPEGRLIPAQTVAAGGYWGHDYVILTFPVKVPALGYALYTVVAETAAGVENTVRQIGRQHQCSYSRYEREAEGLENDLVRVELDMATGGIRSLVDKRSGVALIDATRPAPILEYTVERPHGMSAWLVDHAAAPEPLEIVAVNRKLAGPYKASLEVRAKIHESEITLTYELRADDPQLYLHLQVNWFQRGTAATGVPVLRLTLPLALEQAKGRYEIPFGAIDRELNRGEEVPALQWAQVAGNAGSTPAGVLLLNDSKYGHSLDGSTLRLSLIRSSYEPDPLPEIGQHEIHVALRPFAGELPVAEAVRIGRNFNHRLRVIGTDLHRGILPVQLQGVRVVPDNVILYSLKKAESGDGLILHFFETAGLDTTIQVEFLPEFLGRVKTAVETDLLERSVAKSGAKVAAGGKVRLKIPARGLATLRVTLAKPDIS